MYFILGPGSHAILLARGLFDVKGVEINVYTINTIAQ